ncbi:uncharacterized protein LOC144115904 [Amblyomma americanum]
MRKYPAMFFRYYRMNPQQFDGARKIVRVDLERHHLCRVIVCSEERLAIALRFLSSGMAIKQVAMVFRVAQSTCRLVIHDTCRAIWKHLEPLYMPASIGDLLFCSKYVRYVLREKVELGHVTNHLAAQPRRRFR